MRSLNDLSGIAEFLIAHRAHRSLIHVQSCALVSRVYLGTDDKMMRDLFVILVFRLSVRKKPSTRGRKRRDDHRSVAAGIGFDVLLKRHMALRLSQPFPHAVHIGEN
jgi:hypothetical protein